MSDQYFKAYSISELEELCERSRAERLARRDWGPWRLDTKVLELVHVSTGYPIDLEKITSSAPMLDIIFQVIQKTWCSTEDAGYLLRAFEDIFAPQGHLCGCGIDQKLDASQFLKARYSASKTD